MPRIRIVTTGAIALLLLGAAGAAHAADDAPGQPLNLLKLFHQSTPAATPEKAAHHAASHAPASIKTRVAARKRHHHHMLAARTRHHAATQIAEAAPPPAPTPAPANAFTEAAAIPAPPAADTAPPAPAPAASLTPSQLLVAGQTVQVASPDAVNEIDLAANDTGVQSDAGSSAAGSSNVIPTMKDAADGTKANAVTVAIAQQPNSEIGMTSWLLQVLAALGGAVAAGAAAWFLMGSGPQRTYA
jgi:hypothetical protein